MAETVAVAEEGGPDDEEDEDEEVEAITAMDRLVSSLVAVCCDGGG